MAAGSTYTPIATTTLGSAQATVTFSSFSGYTDLVVVINAAAGIASIQCRYNSDSGSNYSYTRMWGDGSTANSSRESSITANRFGIIGDTNFTTFVYNIQNYSNTTTYKTGLSRSSWAGGYVASYVNLWRSTAAITSIVFSEQGGGNFATGSTFTLYGISAA
jgi:hypothetical protein